ncbi:sororin [Heterodontus francisci]|uniref:sororin n=1 Tax=Heterodontus francisci TaxID=7792 RepID=UPI00355B9162
MEEQEAGGGSQGPTRAQDLCPPTRRKSDRLSATGNKESSVPVAKRSIVLKKIEPQKNVLSKSIIAAPRRSPRISPKTMKENICEGSVQVGSVLGAEAGWGSTFPSTSTTVTPSPKETGDSPDTVPTLPVDRSTAMSQKVRRSYSRLSPFGIHALNRSPSTAGCSYGESPCSSSDASDTSTPNQPVPARRSFFGFERLLASEALLSISPVKPLTSKEKCAELRAQATRTTASLATRDVNIPGVTIAKEKKKKRKFPQIEKSALDKWAAQMNASFEDAERFDLLVE